MHPFERLTFSLTEAERELTSFEAWFARKSFVGETEIVGEIRARPHMCGLLSAIGGMQAPDMIRFELELSGLFRTDLARSPPKWVLVWRFANALSV